ncbi:MAG: RHS repeat-associated core domain-containing protein [Flammeovirgaceae bacterium]|nr:RHS repeat-associated core domain-containing protein [Flammeovirgaceae bacterium]
MVIKHSYTQVHQEENYYPFGLTFNSYQSQNFLEQKFTYNGKEKQDELNVDWLDYGARMYMPELGRWGVIDPLTEKYFGESSYSYTFNNPVFFNDPTGMEGNVYGVPSSQFSAGGSVETVYDANSNGLSFNYGGKSYSSMDAVFEANPNLTSVGVFQYGKKISDAINPAKIEQITTLAVNAIKAASSSLVNPDPQVATSCTTCDSPKQTQGSGPSPWEVGWEWLTGTGPRHRDFTNGDQFTEMLRQHDHVEATRGIIRNNIINGGQLTGKNPYGLGGIEGVGKYLKDYSTLLTGGLTGNLAVTYLGSYGLNWQVTAVNGNLATIMFTVNNSSTIQSAFRPPVLGYTDAWQSTVGSWLNSQFSSGPMSTTSQTIRWTETIKIK